MSSQSSFIIPALIVVVLVIVVMVSLARSSTSTNTNGNSGVNGVVTYGPIKPVCPENESCDATYSNDEIIIYRGQTNEDVTTVFTDANGYYQTALPPGQYTIKVDQNYISPCTRTIVVPSQQYITVDIQCDTGIR